MTEKKSEESEDDEVGAAGKVCQFIQLEGGRDREENELHADGHDRAHGEMVLVQNVDRHTVSSTTCQSPPDKLSQILKRAYLLSAQISINCLSSPSIRLYLNLI